MDRLCCAFAAASLALEAASEEEDEACLTADRRSRNCDWRSAARDDAETGIMGESLWGGGG